MGSLNPGHTADFEKLAKTFVPERFDHRALYRVAHHATSDLTQHCEARICVRLEWKVKLAHAQYQHAALTPMRELLSRS